MAVDMVEFNQLEEIEEDYILEDFFPTPLPYPLQPLIEYRIKLLTKENVVLLGGESLQVNTACVIKKKNTLAMHIKPYENLPVKFESSGYINTNYRGRIVVKLINYNSKKIKLCSGTPVGYIVMQPFSLQ